MDLYLASCQIHKIELEVDENFSVYCPVCYNTDSKGQSKITFLDKNKGLDFSSERLFECCRLHNKEMSFFCVKCTDFICADCICQEHRTHLSGTIGQMAKEAKNLFERLRGKYTKENNELCERSIQFKKDTETIQKFDEKVNQILNKVSSKLDGEIDKEITARTKDLKERAIDIESEIEVVKEKINKKNESLGDMIKILSEGKIGLNHEMKTQSSQTLFLKKNLDLIEPFLKVTTDEREDFNKEIDIHKLRIKANCEVYYKLCLEFVRMVKKREGIILSCINSRLPSKYFRLRRFGEYSCSNVFLKQACLSFKVSKSIRICGIGLCSLKNKLKPLRKDSTLPAEEQTPINAFPSLPVNIKLFENPKDDNSEIKLIGQINSTLKSSLDNISVVCNPVNQYHFVKGYLLDTDNSYTILATLEHGDTVNYIDIWTGKRLHNEEESRSNNIEDVIFQFKEGKLGSDMYELSNGIISDILYSLV